jgi:hypothetical protein
MTLRSIIHRIERDYSQTTRVTREESRGVIRGRLDVPLYLSGRLHNLSHPRTYPTLVTEHSARTPENGLVRDVLTGLTKQLGRIRYSRSTAEGQAAIDLYSWVRARLRRSPWDSVPSMGGLEVTRRASARRIRKRQVSSVAAYAALLTWVNEWTAALGELGAEGTDRVADGILLFPADDAFWNKVFEIWCLRKVAQTLEGIGYSCIDGPLPLYLRSHGPIFRFGGADPGLVVELWFQRQAPLGTPEWQYEQSERALRGIPDLIVTAPGHPPLVIDAKFRAGGTESRSEEIYKMLGYAENFRKALHDPDLHGALLFPGQTPSLSLLKSTKEGRLWVATVGPDIHGPSYPLQQVLSTWL